MYSIRHSSARYVQALLLNKRLLIPDVAESSQTNRVLEVTSSLIRSNDNDSTGFWPPGSLHTLGADGQI